MVKMAGSDSVPEEKFSLKEVLITFQSCLTDNQEIVTDSYVNGWRGLVRFMNSLGSIFSFISKDAVNKIQIMVTHRNGENGDKYETLQSMVKYELDNNLVDLQRRAEHPESGCRTLLRLHRALRWLELFLEKLRTSTEDSKTSVMCTDAYNDSLAQHHAWIIRKAATMAFCVLPGRAAFFQTMNVGSTEQVVAMLGEAMPFISKVYEITEELYKQHNLLELP
ncbi:ceramide-1-phosphate transfer protein [Acipenser oxyrinchus oxyrinchus]|uniref:Ceramide-1-phosphate transfer protein n=1 Tax=Acipenser oxyrinchus oxyrinchus TaxID=40147 RepID=A0AAD8CZA8_ACIOX|nr:ceramide-1-phosphate transfer protein [Acipenser oxyrinchus oxyrinchus]